MTTLSDSLRVLLVDDDINICRTLSLSLRSLQCVVTATNSVAQALSELQSQSFDFILSDFRMGEKTGIDLIHEVKKKDAQAIVVIMTAFASIDNAIEVTKEGAFDYLPKPFTQAQLGQLLKRIRMVVSLKRENQKLKNSENNRDLFWGFTSVASQRLEEFVKKVAPTDATVLLVGESGTGKSELARLIHQRSGRASKPFIVVNCTSLAESLLESEIFGHVKGSFTGAIQDKVGKFELANHGTLFLDEIGDLSPNAQSKLLRFLQERIVERVGSNHTITIDARVIAATNKDLVEAVANGQFREDLYYRLNVFECNVVPVRHRKEDLPVLIQKFVKEFIGSTHATQFPIISTQIMDILLKYSWPGNIREIRNVMERIVLLSAGRQVELGDLPEQVVYPKKSATAASGSDHRFEPLQALDEVERAHISRVLEIETNLERAAEILGITKVTLWRKRKEYGLQ